MQSELYFNFADGTRLARLAVTPQLREQLISGKVVVVRYEGHYAMVPEAAVERIRERDEHSIVPYVAPAETSIRTIHTRTSWFLTTSSGECPFFESRTAAGVAGECVCAGRPAGRRAAQGGRGTAFHRREAPLRRRI